MCVRTLSLLQNKLVLTSTLEKIMYEMVVKTNVVMVILTALR